MRFSIVLVLAFVSVAIAAPVANPLPLENKYISDV